MSWQDSQSYEDLVAHTVQALDQNKMHFAMIRDDQRNDKIADALVLAFKMFIDVYDQEIMLVDLENLLNKDIVAAKDYYGVSKGGVINAREAFCGDFQKLCVDGGYTHYSTWSWLESEERSECRQNVHIFLELMRDLHTGRIIFNTLNPYRGTLTESLTRSRA